MAQVKSKAIVKPGDTVTVVCEEEPTISKDYKITKDGLIVLSFVGAQRVAGLSEDMAAAKISSALLFHRILDRATVKVKIGGAPDEPVTWTGAVTRTGEMPVRQGLRLSDVVAVARPTEGADLSKVKIVTPSADEIVVDFSEYNGSNLKYNPELRGGDKVFFSKYESSPDVMVLGMVKEPGAVRYSKGLTLGDVLDSVGGITETADAASLQVERKSGNNVTVSLDKAKDFKLQPGDVIRVAEQAEVTYVTVQGAVWKPGRLVFKEGLSLLTVLNRAGGVLSTAKLKDITISRYAGGRRKTTKVNLLHIEQGLSGDIALKADDIVEIPNGR